MSQPIIFFPSLVIKCAVAKKNYYRMYQYAVCDDFLEIYFETQ